MKKRQTKAAKFIQNTLQSFMKEGFSTREKFNEESYYLLTKGLLKESFKQDIQKTRKVIKIPKLDPEVDYQRIIAIEGEMDESSWLYGKNDDFINKFESQVTFLLHKYKLSESFRDWIEMSVLYDIPKYFPHYNVEFMMETNTQEVKRTPLTSAEKQLARKRLPDMLGFKKRPPKKLEDEYKTFNKILDSSKNTRRPYRTIKTAHKTLRIGKKDDLALDETAYQRNAGTITYDDLVSRVYSEDVEEKQGPKKLNARLRKQKERLLKRLK
jgi:hypothetical protein